MSEGLDRTNLQKLAVRGALWTVGGVLIGTPIAFVVNILVARVLGVGDYGRFAFLAMVTELTFIAASAGIGPALIQFGSKAHAGGRVRDVQSLLSATQGYRLLIVGPAMTLAVLLVGGLDWYLLAVMLLFGIWIPVAFGGVTATFGIENRTATGAKLGIVENLLAQGLVVLSLLIIATPEAIWAMRPGARAVTTVVAIYFISHTYRRAALTPRQFWRLGRTFWRFALPVGLAGLLSAVALQRSEVLILNHYSSAAEVGLYALAFGLSIQVFSPLQAMVNPLVPAISGLREVEERGIGRAFRRTLGIAAPMAGGTMALGAPLLGAAVPLLYGAEYSDARPLVTVLVFVAGLFFVSYPMEAFISARLRGLSLLSLQGSALTVSLATALLLVPLIGAWGAVVAKFGVATVRLAWMLAVEKHSFGVRRRDALILLTPAFIGGAFGCLSLLWLDSGTGWIQVFVLPLLCLAAFIIVVRLLTLGPPRADVDSILGAAPGRVTRVAAPFLKFLSH